MLLRLDLNIIRCPFFFASLLYSLTLIAVHVNFSHPNKTRHRANNVQAGKE